MKYHSKKITQNGITFDSIKEYKRYCELLLLEQSGAITDLKRQVRFELLPSQKIEGKTAERPVFYIADFVYQDHGKTVVEDTKGFRTKEYILKRKMMLFFHKVQIQEV